MQQEYEYVIVGSGAGGGPLAANLARYGHNVLLLEAGDDQGQNLNQMVPAFHIVASEDPSMRWDFFVKHYDDETQAAKDPKMTWETADGKPYIGTNPPLGSKQKGFYYPRAGTLGGCTAHDAMITILPPDEDWVHIAEITNDPTWKPQQMRRYYERLEKCLYLPEGTAGHGFNGWLETDHPDDIMLTSQKPFIHTVLDAMSSGKGDTVHEVLQDANMPQVDQTDGVYQFTLSMNKRGRRSGPRNYLVATANAKNADDTKKYPIHIRTKYLATKILFNCENGKPKATGIEFLEGKGLYGADPTYDPKQQGARKCVFASREVIVAAGAFNTPQLLKLSGIGPKHELQGFGITVLLDLPGLGCNLQDNPEYAVIGQASQNISLFKNSLFGSAGDPVLKQWVQDGNGPYKSNGDSVIIKKRSIVGKENEHDLYFFGGAKAFPGYLPGYSKAFGSSFDRFSWNVLKVHPHNSRTGTVCLRSNNPRDVPDINFRFFAGENGHNNSDRDLTAMVDAVDFVRGMFAKINQPVGPVKDEYPGSSIQGVDAIKQDIKDKVYSHHASGTCAIGADGDPMACLDSRFRIRGVEGLRVVDASVFPCAPGAYPVLPVFMVSEKATDVIRTDAGLAVHDSPLTEDMGLEE